MTTVKDLAPLLGKAGWVKGECGFHIEVQVTDVRVNFGQVQVEVTPIAGHGTAWINRDRFEEWGA